MDLDEPSAHAEPHSAGGKRKRSSDFTAHSSSPMDSVVLVNPNGISQETPDQPSKRLRLEEAMNASQPASKPIVPSVTDLPPEILQQIFSFVHPITLGRLLPVCKLFNTLLNPVKALPAPSPGVKSVSLRKQNEIWTRSRNIHIQGYPRPMENMTEIEMWRLLRVRRCQFCHRKARRSPSFLNSTPWNGGPGPDDVRTIWPFRIRSCGSCLEPRLIMDKELLLSASSFLADGLPYAFFTPSLHYVTTVNLDQNEPPPNLQLRKYFYRGQVDELEDKIIEVRALGSGAVEEWSKGLGLTGNLRRDDAARFEKWELSMTAHLHIQPGLSTLQAPARPLVTTSLSGSSVMSYGSGPSRAHVQDATMTSPLRPSSAQSSLHSSLTTATSLPPVPEMPLHAFAPAPGQHREMTPVYAFPKAESVASAKTARSQSKTKPNPQEVERLRAEKRADIERRCQSIDPPIRISILPFMEAYNAAIQILRPLNDSAWDTLKHRLIAQRGEAEHKEMELLNNQQALRLDEEERALYEEQVRLDRATNDRIWDELGRPAREKLKSYADDHIATIWDAGIAVTAANSANFAADVLVHVVRRFDDGIIEEDKLLASRNMRLPKGSAIPEVRRLKLEDIKWVYDESVRPFTERFGKEVFLCSICEGTTKRFTFDGVIQHFAAKHTNDLSKGTQVVYWKADWPRDPPFHTYPESVWNKPPAPRPAPHSVLGLIPYNVPGFATRAISPDGSMARSSTLADQTRRPSLYEQHCDEMTEAAIDTLHLTEGIRGLPDSVRLYLIVHRLVRSFRSKFPTNHPTLAMFIDCVSHRSSLRCMRDFHGLRCKACSMERRAYQHVPKEYWLLELLSHFQASHPLHALPHETRFAYEPDMLAAEHVKQLEWTHEMIELPHSQIIRNLAHAPGMDDLKFAAFRNLFPAVFARDGLDQQDRHYYPVTRYYIPLDQDRQQLGHAPMHRPSNSFDHSAHRYQDPRDSYGRDGPAYYPSMSDRRPDFLPTSPGYLSESVDDLRYRPRREIVYFDEPLGPSHNSAQVSDPGSHGDRTMQYQSTALVSGGPGKAYTRRDPIPMYSAQHVEPHDLPLRLLHAEGTPEDSGDVDRQPQQHDVATDEPRASLGTPATQESGAQAADRFLSTFEPGPLMTSDDRATSMSRTASMQRRAVPDLDTASVRSSRMSTPGRIRRDASAHPSQPVTRVDTPAESHYGRRTMSRNSVAAKSEASDAYRLHEIAAVSRPRTPPASQSPYSITRSSTQGYARPAEWYETSPPDIRRDHPETRPAREYVMTGYPRASQRYSPVQGYHDTVRAPPRFVSDRDHNEQRPFEQTVSPEIAQYEFSRHPTRETAYPQLAVPRGEFRDAQYAPVSYSEDIERSRPAERHSS